MSLILDPPTQQDSLAVLRQSSLWNDFEIQDEPLPLLARGPESEQSPLPPAGASDPRTLRASLHTHRSQLGTLNLTNANNFTTERRISFEGALKVEVDALDESWAMARIDLGSTLRNAGDESGQYGRGVTQAVRSHERFGDVANFGQRAISASRQIIRMYLEALSAQEDAYLTASPALLTNFPQGGARGWSVRWGDPRSSAVIPLEEAVREFALRRGGPPTCVDHLFEYATEINVRGPSVFVSSGFEITPGFVPLLNARSGGPLAETLEEDFTSQSTNPNLLKWDTPRTCEVTLVHELILRRTTHPASAYAS